MDTVILRSVAEGSSSIISCFIFFSRRTRKTVFFFLNKGVTVVCECAATHVAVVCRYAAMISAGCGDATGFPFPNNQPGALMIRNSGCHLRTKKSNDKQPMQISWPRAWYNEK